MSAAATATSIHHYHHHHHQHSVAYPFPASFIAQLPNQQVFFPPPFGEAQQQALPSETQHRHLRIQAPADVVPYGYSGVAGWPGTRSLPHTPPPHRQSATAGVLSSLNQGSSFLLNNNASSQPTFVDVSQAGWGGSGPLVEAAGLSRQASTSSQRRLGHGHRSSSRRSLIIAEGPQSSLNANDDAESTDAQIGHCSGERSLRQEPEPGLCSDCCDQPCPCLCPCCCPKGSMNTVAVSFMCVFIIFFIVLSPLFHYAVPG